MRSLVIECRAIEVLRLFSPTGILRGTPGVDNHFWLLWDSFGGKQNNEAPYYLAREMNADIARRVGNYLGVRLDLFA